jgi:5'(3')-deoxyribonucleotidase
MTKIGISLNEVLRDYLGQLIYTYKKYINTLYLSEEEVTDLKEAEFTDFDFGTKLGFKKNQDFLRFLFIEAALEISGHADQLTDGLMNHFNLFLNELREADYDVQLVSREASKSIPATFFFLSKTACAVDKLRFVRKDAEEWGNVDILITANPIALANKPKDKLAIKIKSPYNTDAPADYELDSILDIIKDVTLRNKILNTKITTFEDF